MNPDLEHLIVLQAQDLELVRLRSELAELPRRLGAAKLLLQNAQTVLATLQTALAAEEKLRRGQEQEVASLKDKAARLRRSLEAATSATQVSAFQREIEFAEAGVERLEGEELASMERSEQMEGEQRQAQAEVVRQSAELQAEGERGRRNEKEWIAQIAGLEEQRKALRTEIAEDPLALYDRLRKSKGTAVAEALGTATQGKCAACQMSVRPQRWQDLIGRDHLDEIYTCESCGRMLCWDPRRDTPKAWEAGDRLRRAQTGSAR